MSHLPVADWQSALDEMETALARTRAALDEYQTAWTELLADHEPNPDARPELDALRALEARLSQWDARLSAAEELARSVEHQLADGAAAVGRWRELFTAWQELIQQRGEAHTAP